MFSTTQELEKDIARLEERLETVQRAVASERSAWQRQSQRGATGTKWKGAAQSGSTKNEHALARFTACDASTADRPVTVFPLIAPRTPEGGASTMNESKARPGVASKPRCRPKPATRKRLPVPICWNCKVRFLRPPTKNPVARAFESSSYQSLSASLQASLVARVFCSDLCRERVESAEICIVPASTARVNRPSSLNGTHGRPPRGKPEGQSFTPFTSCERMKLCVESSSIKTNQLEEVEGHFPKGTRRGTVFRHRANVPPKEPRNSNVLHVAAENCDLESLQPRCANDHSVLVSGSDRRSLNRSIDVHGFKGLKSSRSVAPRNGNPVPLALLLDTSIGRGVPIQGQGYQQSRYKLDMDVYQENQESFSSCFGAVPISTQAQRAVVAQHCKTFLRLQEFITVRTLHRLSLASRSWYTFITKPSAFSDALWNVHVRRVYKSAEDDQKFLHDIGVVQKPERPRRLLQTLTRHVSRVVIENMKVLLDPESWQLATVVSCSSMESLHQIVESKRSQRSIRNDESKLYSELYEQITPIYARTGEIVAICARELIRPLHPTALVADILQRLTSGELCRVNCRRLRLFSLTNRLPFNQWALLSHCRRAVVGFFWSNRKTEGTVVPLPSWHQKIWSKLQHGLQQRLLSKESVNCVIKYAHDQQASAAVLFSLETLLKRDRSHADRTIKST